MQGAMPLWVKQFMWRTSMSKKSVVTIGYTKYVMDTQKALALLDILADAELYEDKYRTKESGGTTYHVWEQDHAESLHLRLVPDSFYRMCKLAGKPE